MFESLAADVTRAALRLTSSFYFIDAFVEDIIANGEAPNCKVGGLPCECLN